MRTGGLVPSAQIGELAEFKKQLILKGAMNIRKLKYRSTSNVG